MALRARKRLLRVAAAAPEPVADGVWLIRGGLFRAMNAYLIEDGGSVVLFDAGEKGMAAPIAAAARDLGGISKIVLGHADTDHRGSAPALSDVPVLCHPDAVADAEGTGGRDHWNFEELPPVVRRVQIFSHDHVWDGGPVKISGTLREGDEVAGFTVVELAGHAPGLIGLWRERDRLAVEDSLIEPQRYRGVFEVAVAEVAEETVGPLEAADDEVELAVVAEVAPGRTRG